MFNMTLSVFFNDFTALHHTILYNRKYFASQIYIYKNYTSNQYLKKLVNHMVFRTIYKSQPLSSATYANVEEATVRF